MIIKIILIIVAFIAVGLFEIPVLVQKKYWRELVIFTVFLIPAFVLSLLQGIGVKLPQILPVIDKLTKPVMSWLS